MTLPSFTSSTAIDSLLFRDAFGTPAMRAIFADSALVSRYIEAEGALARAQGRCGVIPAEAAHEIAQRCSLDALDFELLRKETDIVGYPILPLVHQLVKQCGEASPLIPRCASDPDIIGTGTRPGYSPRHKRPPVGWLCATAMPSACRNCARACWWASSRGRQARWPR